VFSPVPGKGQRPAYSYGAQDGPTRAVMFQCPVSAIPDVAFDLLELWLECRTMKALPLAGGWTDQPLLVRRAFPVFETEMQALEAQRRAGTGAGAPRAAAGGGKR
jgi:hypothetical protein